MKKVSKNVKETTEIARIFLEKILKEKKITKGATVVCLSGNLGAGKTAFAQGIAKYLGVKNKVVSPTFVIMKKYPIAERAPYGAGPIKNQKHRFLFHIDAYRLKNEKELLNLGWKEIISDKNHLVFIEWPENVKKIIPPHAKCVYISNNKKDLRILELK